MRSIRLIPHVKTQEFEIRITALGILEIHLKSQKDAYFKVFSE